jgi:S1-C subfamily serine protease
LDSPEPPWRRQDSGKLPVNYEPANSRRAPAGEPEPPLVTGESRGTPAVALRLVALVGLGAGILGAIVGGAAVAMLASGNNGDSGPSDAGDSRAVAVEFTGAVSEVAARARAGVVRVESATNAGGTDIGSGVVIDARQGYILTNAHVVLRTDTLQVVLADGTVRPAVLVGHDSPFTDVAVLQISPGGLTEIPAGDSSVLKLGETVIAIGNPLAEFDGSVTVGVVSGLNRSRVYDGVRQDDLIQTDAAVNSGNSGGALLNLEGQLVGVPMSVLRETRAGAQIQGIAFALPSERALDIAERIIAQGDSIARPTLDLEAVDLSPATLAQFRRLPVSEGALVLSVRPGGAGAEAGILASDVIIEVGGIPLNGQDLLQNVLARFSPGDSVQVVLNRNGRIIEAEVTLAKRS